MINQHPITPPPELVGKWIYEANHNEPMFAQVAVMGAQWGADQELEACCRWIEAQLCMPPDARADVITQLDGSRRPKPPSLKEQALDAWDRLRNEAWCEKIDFDLDFVRRALETLDD